MYAAIAILFVTPSLTVYQAAAMPNCCEVWWASLFLPRASSPALLWSQGRNCFSLNLQYELLRIAPSCTRIDLWACIILFRSLKLLLSVVRSSMIIVLWQCYCLHLNGFVRKNGKDFLWISKRSKKKKSFTGVMDNMVAAAQVWFANYIVIPHHESMVNGASNLLYD